MYCNKNNELNFFIAKEKKICRTKGCGELPNFPGYKILIPYMVHKMLIWKLKILYLTKKMHLVVRYANANKSARENISSVRVETKSMENRQVCTQPAEVQIWSRQVQGNKPNE